MKKPKATKPPIVHVGDITHPTLCWKQNTDIRRPKNIMARCTFPKGHRGKHSWW